MFRLDRVSSVIEALGAPTWNSPSRQTRHTDWLWRELALLQEQRRWFELALTFVDDTTPPSVEARIHLGLALDLFGGDSNLSWPGVGQAVACNEISRPIAMTTLDPTLSQAARRAISKAVTRRSTTHRHAVRQE